MDTASGFSTLAELVRHFRSLARLSQEELAERAGVSARTVSDIECGVARSPRAVTLSLLAEALALDAGDKQRLYALVRRSPAPPDLPAGVATVSKLPQGPPRLIGRAAELGAARALLATGAHRLLNCLGPAGVGKTAFVLELGRELRGSFERVLFVDLGSLPDAGFVATKIAVAAGVKEASGSNALAALAAALEEHRTLLLLDTFEHVMAAAPAIEDLLEAAPSLTIVTSSRAPLTGGAGRVLRIEPLPLPAPGSAPADVAANPAVELLVERVRDVRPDFEVTAANASVVADLVRNVWGVPLAIELAAPLLRMLPAAAVAARLADPLPLLVTTRSGVPLRQRTMRGAIAWSHELLGPDERIFFRRLSVFRAPFDAAAAERIAASEGGGDMLGTLRLIAALVDHNLLRAAGNDEDVEPSFAFSPLVREFAFELLSASDDADPVFERLAAYVLEAARRVSFQEPASQSRESLERLTAAIPNIDAVFDWTLATGRIELGIELAQALWAYWWVTGSFASGVSRLTALIARAEGGSPVSDAHLANAYIEAAGLTEAHGEFERADELAERALPIKRRLNDLPGIAAILNGKGVRASERCEFEKAREYFEAGLAIRQQIGNRLLVGQSYADLGHSAFYQGDTVGAAAYLQQALAAFRDAHSELGIGVAFASLGAIAANQNLFDRAETFSREAERVATAVGHGASLALVTFNLGLVALGRGEYDEAEKLLRDALAAYQASEASSELPYVVEALAEVLAAKGHPREAARLLGAAHAHRQRARKLMFPVFEARYGDFIAALRMALGDDVFDDDWLVGSALRIERAVARDASVPATFERERFAT